MLLLDNFKHIDTLYFKKHRYMKTVGTLVFKMVNKLNIVDFFRWSIWIIFISGCNEFRIWFMCFECIQNINFIESSFLLMLSWLLNLHSLNFLINNILGKPHSTEVTPTNLFKQNLIIVENLTNERRMLPTWPVVDLAFLIRVYTFRLV